MTDLEKELVEKLAREWLTTHLDPRYANAEDVWRPNDVISLASVIRSHANALVERREESVRADTIMRFRKVLDRLDIHGYYNEMQSEFGCEEASLSKPAPVKRSNENE